MKSFDTLTKELNGESVVNEDLDAQYDALIQKLQEAKENHTPINEGLFSSILGGATMASFGPAVMTAVCNALGIDVKGALGNLMTSRLILTAVGAKIGWRV